MCLRRCRPSLSNASRNNTFTRVDVASAVSSVAIHLRETTSMMPYTTWEPVQAMKRVASQHHSWFGSHCTHSGHGLLTERGGRGMPASARPLRARTRSTLEGDTKTRSR